MKRKIISILFALVLLVGLSLIPAVPARASVTSATVGVDPTSAGEAAEYTITFNVGGSGALAPDDTITIIFPDDTAVADDTGLQDNIEGTVNAVEIVTVIGTSGDRTVVITVPATVNIANDGEATVVLTVGITNPTAAGDYTLTVATNKELTDIESQTYTIVDEAAAIADAEAALTASAAAKTAHLAAGGDAGDTEYVAVVTAEGALNTALTAVPAVTADIVAATTALETATALLVAITNGNVALTASAVAKTAYETALGDTGEAVYTDVEDAETDLTDAIAGGVTATIVTETTDLNDAVALLEAETANLVAITNGNAALVLSAEAKTAYETALGDTGEAVYTDVETAETDLTNAIAGGVTATIVTETTDLNDAVALLEDATEALVLATADGEAALVDSGLAKTAHLAAGGEVTIAEYLAVVDAEIALDEALAADPLVTGDLTGATTTLNDAVAALVVLTDALPTAITAAEAALVLSAAAKTAHTDAGGAVTDTEYADVETAEDALTAALTAVPKVTATIEEETTDLTGAVTLLEDATDALAAAITDAEDALVLSGLAKTAHTDAGGAVIDAEYEAVEAEEDDLNTALTAVPKVTATIEAETTDLGIAVTDLVAATVDLAAAITDAEAALVLSAAAKTAHTDAGGNILVAEYEAVEAAEDVLTAALTAVPKVTATIEEETTDLGIAVGALGIVTEPLALAVAVADGEAALATVSGNLTAHIAAGGADTDTEYTDVEDAEDVLTTALGVGPPQVTADVVAATTALNTAVAALETVTDLWTTYDVFLTLNEGWTLISTDKYIISSGDNTSVWEGDATLKFKFTGVAFVEADFADLKPVEALYVKMPAGGWVGLNYLDASPGMSAKELVEGWNLISSGVEASAGAVLSPLQDIGSQGTGLTTLVSQDAYNRNTTPSWYIDATGWAGLDVLMSPFDGYWIYMNAGKDFGVILQ